MSLIFFRMVKIQYSAEDQLLACLGIIRTQLFPQIAIPSAGSERKLMETCCLTAYQ
jgi:hypothetical protein